MLAISSEDGFCSIACFDRDELGVPRILPLAVPETTHESPTKTGTPSPAKTSAASKQSKQLSQLEQNSNLSNSKVSQQDKKDKFVASLLSLIQRRVAPVQLEASALKQEIGVESAEDTHGGSCQLSLV